MLIFIINNLLKLWHFWYKMWIVIQIFSILLSFCQLKDLENRFLQISRLKKKKSVKKVNEARAVNKIEANLPQEKINFINDAHAKEVDY